MQIQKYYFVGLIFLAIFWLISWGVTKNPNPFAMAKGSGKNGENLNHNASVLQMLVFTMLTIFAYTTVFAARAMNGDNSLLRDQWLVVPSNLLILMGISVGTAAASRAITVQNLPPKPEGVKSENIPVNEDSSLTTDSDGRTDLVKIQMLIWTAVAVVVYLTILWRFMINGCYLLNPTGTCVASWGNSLPDIDSAFMILLGVSQGGYVVNKLAQTPPKENGAKQNEKVEPPDRQGVGGALSGRTTQAINPAKQGQIGDGGQVANISIEPTTANLTADSPNLTLTAMAKNPAGNSISDLSEDSFQWGSDNPEVATIDSKGLVTRVATGNCNVTATANAIVSNKCEVICA